MKKLSGKTAIITGASRGIGREIALRLAQEQVNIVIAAKTQIAHQNLEGTIQSVAQEVQDLGAQALAFQIDVRESDRIEELAQKAHDKFGSIDILINNAGAIYLSDTQNTSAKQFDLMQNINTRATFLMSKAVIKYMKHRGGHIINMSPKLDLNTKWLSSHIAYTLSKYGMSMCTLAMAEEFKNYNISVNSLWPKTLIYTAAITRLLGEEAKKNCRSPKIISEAIVEILNKPANFTGNLLYDEEVLEQSGITNFDNFRLDVTGDLLPDLYVS